LAGRFDQPHSSGDSSVLISSVTASTAITAALGTNSRALWYMTRGFGLIALVLLTATLVMGVTQVVRYARPGLPRFVISALHKNISLLAVVFLIIHVVTAVLDTFVSISLVSVFIPFVGTYRPLWLGLGALSLDLLVALVITSLLRERLGHTAWRLIHWAAYLCWPVAVLHGLGTGTDTKLGWVLALNALCVASVIGAVWWRLAEGWSPANAGRRAVAAFGTFALPLAVGVWTVSGPLKAGWAKKAGTPAALIGSANRPSSAAQASGGSSPSTGIPALSVPFSSAFQGTQTQSDSRDGLVTLTLSGTFSTGSFQVTLTGQPAGGGGVELTSSQVALGPSSAPNEYTGRVTNLSGDTIVAPVSGGSGRSFTVTIQITSMRDRSFAGTIQGSS
jgi:sulfoxide reductase heme-binding subunit YedZ